MAGPGYDERVNRLTEKARAHARHLRNQALARRTGASVDSTADVRAGVVIQEGAVIGPWCFLNRRVEVEAGAVLGSNVSLAPDVKVYTYTHELGPAQQRAGALVHRPVTIGDGCWLGTNAVVMPGVTIAPGCVIGAGAIVTKDTEPNGLYAGVPARRVRDLD